MNRHLAIRILAALIGIRAVTNFWKTGGGHMGFVLFGLRLESSWSLVAGLLMGLFMMAYVVAAWTRRRVAIPMGVAYAIYATLNIVLFPIVTGLGDISPLAYFGFALAGIGVSWGMVFLLRSGKDELT